MSKPDTTFIQTYLLQIISAMCSLQCQEPHPGQQGVSHQPAGQWGGNWFSRSDSSISGVVVYLHRGEVMLTVGRIPSTTQSPNLDSLSAKRTHEMHFLIWERVLIWRLRASRPKELAGNDSPYVLELILCCVLSLTKYKMRSNSTK
jgi:hypothetical protein